MVRIKCPFLVVCNIADSRQMLSCKAILIRYKYFKKDIKWSSNRLDKIFTDRQHVFYIVLFKNNWMKTENEETVSAKNWFICNKWGTFKFCKNSLPVNVTLTPCWYLHVWNLQENIYRIRYTLFWEWYDSFSHTVTI